MNNNLKLPKSFSQVLSRRRSSQQSSYEGPQHRISELIDSFVDHTSFENTVVESPRVKEFIQKTYTLHCQCDKQCIYQEENYLPQNQPKCDRILATDDAAIKSYISYTIELFKSLNLVYEVHGKYYMYNSKLLTWANIKNLQNTKMKKIFWMFRKGIVDNIIKIILFNLTGSTEGKNQDIFVYSVGSTTLSSDYDITIYASPTTTVKIIKAFAWHIKKRFSIDSSTLFDTNIYGKGFITFKPDGNTNMYQKTSCGNTPFLYLKANDVYKESQLMWALVKYLRDLQSHDAESQDDDVSESVKNFLLKKFSGKKYCEFLKIAIKLNSDLSLLVPNGFTDGSGTYISILNIEDSHLSPVKSPYNELDFENQDMDKEANIEVLKHTDFISLVNYFGSETYYTRGAFLDIVVNNQMCKSQASKIALSDYDYMQSILENAGFCITHGHTTKYFMRVKSAFEKLSRNIQKQIIVPPSVVLDELDNQHYISDYNNEKQDLSNDEIVKLQKYIIKFVYKVLKAFFEFYYADDTKNLYIPFKNYNLDQLINKEREEKGLQRSRSKSTVPRPRSDIVPPTSFRLPRIPSKINIQFD